MEIYASKQLIQIFKRYDQNFDDINDYLGRLVALEEIVSKQGDLIKSLESGLASLEYSVEEDEYSAEEY